MKKLLALVLALMLIFCVCACDTGEADYSDGDGNSELISLENKKVSRDDIEFNVVSIEEEQNKNLIKRYKSVYEKEDFTVKIEKAKGGAYVAEEDLTPQYPEKTLLPEYDIAALKAVMLELYAVKAKEPLSEEAFVSEPKFSIKSFTGKLVVTYNVYFEPETDEMGITRYKSQKRVKLTGDLYTYEVE